MHCYRISSHLNQLYFWLVRFVDVRSPYSIYALCKPVYFSNFGRSNFQRIISSRGKFGFSLPVIGLISLTLYLTWTPVGNFEVLGVQGRYYLGVVALCHQLFVVYLSKGVPDEQKFSDHFVVQSSLIILSLTLLQTISVLYAAV